MNTRATGPIAAFLFLAPLGGCRGNTSGTPPSPSASAPASAPSVTDATRPFRSEEGFSFRYPAAEWTEVRTTAGLPGAPGERRPAVKLLRPADAARLGRNECSYGQSGETVECTAEKEPGIALFVADSPLAGIRASLDGSLVESTSVAGREALRYSIGAEGEGIDWLLVPMNDRTLVIEILKRRDRAPAADAILRTLELPG